MVMNRESSPGLRSVRPLVRYVDEQQAVIDTLFCLENTESLKHTPAEVHVRLIGPKGRVITYQSSVALRNDRGMVRFEIGDPRRWWPAGMGDQELYEFHLTLLVGDEATDTWETTLGMTSVRTQGQQAMFSLLVNGREYEIQSIVSIEPADEASVLPASGDTLLLVRDHFGPDVLYDATDRAGILLIQSVPVSPEPECDVQVSRQIDRLAAHPSLAGWLVASRNRFADRMARRIHRLDPTRTILRDINFTQ